MAWFARDHTGRALSQRERDFLAALTSLLAGLHLPQLDEHETALTAELDRCLFALIPHRALGGISLVVALMAHRAEVVWAQVAHLGCCHDTLDAGISADDVRLDDASPDFTALLESVRQQLHAPVTLEMHGDDRAVVTVRNRKGARRSVGELGRLSTRWERLWPGTPTGTFEVRFTDAGPPPLAEPSHVDEWFTTRR